MNLNRHVNRIDKTIREQVSLDTHCCGPKWGDTFMREIFTIQLSIALLFILLGWAIRKKKAYWLISGFANRSREEQQQLIENGSPQRTGTLLIATAIGMILLLPLHFTSFKYAMEAQFGFMIVFLLGGLIYLSKYEIAAKRKRSYIFSTSIALVVLIFLGVLSYFGYQEYKLVAGRSTFEVSGMYGDKWKYSDIERIELLEKMPEVTFKQNGFGLSTMAKGYFKVKGYGSSLLFIQKGSSPCVYIKMKKQKIFINGSTAEQTRAWYNVLNRKLAGK